MLGLAVRANGAARRRHHGADRQRLRHQRARLAGAAVPERLPGCWRLLSLLGPVYDTGPIHLIVSYLGKIYLSVTTCREIVPDIGHYAACLQQSWDELRRRNDRRTGVSAGASGAEDAAKPRLCGRRPRKDAVKANWLVEWQHAPEIAEVDEPLAGTR